MERKNLWAPWRIKYIKRLGQKSECFICHYRDHPDDDDENCVLWRTKHCMVIFNRFPYNNGHLLIAPNRHIQNIDDTNDPENLEMMKLVIQVQQVLNEAIFPGGFNIGINIGRCAGAGLPDHLHIHVVPRWDGDTNYMPVCSDIDVISQGLKELYDELKEISIKKNLPKV